MSVEEFLKEKSSLSDTGARLAYEDKWMTFSEAGNFWVVYQRKNGTQKMRVLYAGDQGGALEILERGLTNSNRHDAAAPDPVAGEQAGPLTLP
jgi:hypothetical protein